MKLKNVKFNTRVIMKDVNHAVIPNGALGLIIDYADHHPYVSWDLAHHATYEHGGFPYVLAVDRKYLKIDKEYQGG